MRPSNGSRQLRCFRHFVRAFRSFVGLQHHWQCPFGQRGADCLLHSLAHSVLRISGLTLGKSLLAALAKVSCCIRSVVRRTGARGIQTTIVSTGCGPPLNLRQWSSSRLSTRTMVAPRCRANTTSMTPRLPRQLHKDWDLRMC
jgi:hypothetical protein